jgi:hypothetical protein
MPFDVARILSIRDTTNDLTLKSASVHWYVGQEPDPSGTTGNPEVWVPIGYGPLRIQPSDASTLYAVSSSASDTMSIVIEGVRAGNLTSATVTMTGATAVSLGAWTEVHKIHLLYLPAGTIEIWEDAQTTGTLLGTLPIGKTGFRYYTFALWPTPSSALTLTVDYQRQVQDMVSNTDEPLWPEDFHWVLAAGARMLEWEKQDDSRWQAARQEYEKGVRDLKWFVHQQTNSTGRATVGSRLGPWYPKGS